MTLIARHGPAWTFVDYHQFFLMEPGHEDFVPEEYGRLISPTGEAVIVHTGIAIGNVAVHIEIHDHEPPLDDTDCVDWEEVAEAGMRVEKGTLMVRCLMDDPPDLPVLTPAGPGTYRVRAYARGRDTAYDLAVSQSQEVYLFQIWPASYLPLHVLKQADLCGKGLRRPAHPLRSSHSRAPLGQVIGESGEQDAPALEVHQAFSAGTASAPGFR